MSADRGAIRRRVAHAIGPKSLDVYPVNYEASSDFSDRIQFAQSVVDGIKDASSHIEATAANCPKTRIVLGGYSQGAAVAGFVTSASIPAGVPAEYVPFLPKPMPPEIANHVAAVTLFGKPSAQWLQNYGAPAVVIGPLYVPKTDRLVRRRRHDLQRRSRRAAELRARLIPGERHDRAGRGFRRQSPVAVSRAGWP